MPLRRLAAIALVAGCALMVDACSGINFGLSAGSSSSNGALSDAINESNSTFVILDLASGTRTTAVAIPDLTSNSAYRTSKMVFRRVPGLGPDYMLGVFEVTQGQWQARSPRARRPLSGPWWIPRRRVRRRSDLVCRHSISATTASSPASAHTVPAIRSGWPSRSDAQWQYAWRRRQHRPVVP